jgi:hypothetical protein
VEAFKMNGTPRRFRYTIATLLSVIAVFALLFAFIEPLTRPRPHGAVCAWAGAGNKASCTKCHAGMAPVQVAVVAPPKARPPLPLMPQLPTGHAATASAQDCRSCHLSQSKP